MPEITIPCGDESQTLTLPDDWTIQQIAESAQPRADEDWHERLARTLAKPASGPSLPELLAANRQGRIAIILEDVTRHSPLEEILPIVMREVRHAGINDDQVELVFACGMHPEMTARQVADKIGAEWTHLTFRSNAWQDSDSYVPVGKVGRTRVLIDRGVAEADVRIIVSSVSVHLQAGFGGGYKMLFPGCAAQETIRGIHTLGIKKKGQHQLGGTTSDTNPMRRAIDAAGLLVDGNHGATFAVQYLLDGSNCPTAIACGEVIPAQHMLAKQCSTSDGVLINNQADVLITNAYPRDHDLWQSFKAIANTRFACRPDGVIICMSRCEAAMEGMDVPKFPLTPKGLRRFLCLFGSNGISTLILRLLPKLAGDAAFFIRMATQTLQRNPIIMVSPILHAAGKFPGLQVVGTLEDAIEIAKTHLEEGPQRVTVFPTGGTSYPLPSAYDS
jgi:lactate racemase